MLLLVINASGGRKYSVQMTNCFQFSDKILTGILSLLCHFMTFISKPMKVYIDVLTYGSFKKMTWVVVIANKLFFTNYRIYS